MFAYVPRTAEKMQGAAFFHVPPIAEHKENQMLKIRPMDYKKEIGRRIREARLAKDWTLKDLSRRTNDVLDLKRIGAYEIGERMPGPSEAVILAKALGTRPAYLLAVDDIQTPISVQEESLIRNWRTLAERDRMAFFRQIEQLAMASRDPVPNSVVERHYPVAKKRPVSKVRE